MSTSEPQSVYQARRVRLSTAMRAQVAPVGFHIDERGRMSLLLMPPLSRDGYAAEIPDDVAATVRTMLQDAGRSMLPLLLQDGGDFGPAAGLLKRLPEAGRP